MTAYATDTADLHASSRHERPGARESSHAQFEALIERARGGDPLPTAVAWPCEAHALEGPLDAADERIITPILIGDAERIEALAKEIGRDLSSCRIVDRKTSAEAAAEAVAAVHRGEALAVMKGSLHTDVLMHAVVGADGLRGPSRITHVFVEAAPHYPDLLFITDAAINISPDLEAKRDIVQNAIDLHIGLGLGTPRVAILSAVEVVNPKIPGTIDAACLCKMAERGQITGGILDGPLAMDNAVDLEAAKIKGIDSPVAGRAQILVVPDLEAGNMLAKNLIFMAESESAGLVLGAKVPIILTSRADSVRARLASTAIGALYARHLAEGGKTE